MSLESVFVLAVGVLALAAAVFAVVLREELVEARLREVQRRRWLQAGMWSGERATRLTLWAVILTFVLVGLGLVVASFT